MNNVNFCNPIKFSEIKTETYKVYRLMDRDDKSLFLEKETLTVDGSFKSRYNELKEKWLSDGKLRISPGKRKSGELYYGYILTNIEF